MNTGRLARSLSINPRVQAALDRTEPVVAIESTVIAHGLPQPHGVGLAFELEERIAERGAVPATIGIVDGRPTIGLTRDEIALLASSPHVRKVSPRDLPIVTGARLNGATTVAGTMVLADRAGIKVLATGGIGGVHLGAERTMDISADLPALASVPMVVVCSGPKTLVDAARTLEWLETHGVPVLGYRTSELPRFYTRESDLSVNYRVESADEVASVAISSWQLGLPSAVLVTVPAPLDQALDAGEVDEAVEAALAEAASSGIRGQQVTPFVLARLRELTGDKALSTNLALLRSNAEVAAEVSVAIARRLHSA